MRIEHLFCEESACFHKAALSHRKVLLREMIHPNVIAHLTAKSLSGHNGTGLGIGLFGVIAFHPSGEQVERTSRFVLQEPNIVQETTVLCALISLTQRLFIHPRELFLVRGGGIVLHARVRVHRGRVGGGCGCGYGCGGGGGRGRRREREGSSVGGLAQRTWRKNVLDRNALAHSAQDPSQQVEFVESSQRRLVLGDGNLTKLSQKLSPLLGRNAFLHILECEIEFLNYQSRKLEETSGTFAQALGSTMYCDRAALRLSEKEMDQSGSVRLH
mmetsp:Transcript_44716/g.112712  ORF Transcript_44716/g.112712 Transcript_44716/m.112712 type:complete len:272 (+) Transcript_44716:2777-3592(+)